MLLKIVLKICEKYTEEKFESQTQLIVSKLSKCESYKKLKIQLFHCEWLCYNFEYRHSRLVLKDFVCESVFISALRFLFCSNHKRCRTVYFTKNYTKIEILAIWKVSDLYPKSNTFQSGLSSPWMSQNHGHALVQFWKTRLPYNGPESDFRHLYQIP